MAQRRKPSPTDRESPSVTADVMVPRNKLYNSYYPGGVSVDFRRYGGPAGVGTMTTGTGGSFISRQSTSNVTTTSGTFSTPVTASASYKSILGSSVGPYAFAGSPTTTAALDVYAKVYAPEVRDKKDGLGLSVRYYDEGTTTTTGIAGGPDYTFSRRFTLTPSGFMSAYGTYINATTIGYYPSNSLSTTSTFMPANYGDWRNTVYISPVETGVSWSFVYAYASVTGETMGFTTFTDLGNT